MNLNEVRKIAKRMRINTNSLKKTDIIRAIQRAENTYDCFGTERVGYCQEEICLWKKDCSWQDYQSRPFNNE